MTALPQRLRAMAIGWGTVGVAYALAGVLQGSGGVLDRTALDRLVPFEPWGVWVYLSFFALIPFAYLHADTARVPWLMRAMQLSAFACSAVFLLFPTTMHYPAYGGASLSAAALRSLAAYDSAQNCLPSLHAVLSLLTARALFDARRPYRTAIVLLWSAAIVYSTLQTRRHLSVDILAGLTVAFVCGVLSGRLPAAFRNVA